MEYFLRPENASIWAEVQDLADNDDKTALRGYVAEAQRLTSPFKIICYPARSTQVEGKTVGPDNVVILTVVSIPYAPTMKVS